MGKRNSLIHIKSTSHQTSLRRSPRFTQKQIPSKNQVCSSPISSSKKTQTHSPFTVQDSTIQTTTRRKSLRLIAYSENKENLVDGFRKAERLTDGAEGLKSLRRSPRFSDVKNIILGVNIKTKDKKSTVNEEDNKFENTTRRKSLRLIAYSENKENLADGFRKAERLTDGADGLKNLRRSPRFSDVKNVILGVNFKTKDKNFMVNEEDNEFENGVLTDFSEKRVCSVRRGLRKPTQKAGKIHGKKVKKPMTVDVHEMSTQFKDCIVTEFQEGFSCEEDCGNDQRTSVRLMGFGNDVKKIELGVNGDEELGKNTEGKVRKGDFEVSTVTPTRGEKRRKTERGSKEIGIIKRRDGKCQVGHDLNGWTDNQEMALRRAFLAAKPSPHFWKKVSRLVPGKSPQDCFDKVHSELVTPPQTQPRSRTNKNFLSSLGDFTLSASKVLKPLNLNVKMPRSSKQKSLVAQKKVRHLLRKHHLVDQSYEADLFSVLETPTNLSHQALSDIKDPSTAECTSNPSGFLQKCYNISSSHKEMPSGVKNSCRASLVSPLVLKQVKNMALHEKYIDQLHSRESKRNKTAFARATNTVVSEDGSKESCVQKTDVKAARIALVLDARDVIKQFQEIQSGSACEHGVLDADDDNDDGNGCEDSPF
ncbi:homeodomain-like superfamily protein [Tasmannia lanceolata]|uniref:homeodomain-like superfamily protein n=1 Tax=Tasmannia lanceolata TaxID=3420 RepID=UPI0040633922